MSLGRRGKYVHVFNKFLSQYQGIKGLGQDRSPRAWAAFSPPQQDLNDEFQIINHRMKQKTAFSGRKKDPMFQGKNAAKSLQSYPTLCDPIDGSPPGSPVPGILQARTLEWVAMSFSNVGK